jgi:hypothetical protein
MKKFVQRAWKATQKALSPWLYRNRHLAVTIDELPDSLQAKRLYLIGTDAPWSAALLCPCGCKEVIHLSLLAHDSPSWSVNLDRRSLPTLAPSVW